MRHRVLLLMFLLPLLIQAQLRPKLELKLLDGTELTLLLQPSLDETVAPMYYYLPTNLRLSEVGGRPEFSFLTFRPDSLSPLEGGIMHLLMTWGLTQAQFREAEDLLMMRTDSTAYLGGSAWLNEDPAHPTLEIVSDKPLAELLRRSINSAAHTPLNAGGKLAVSFEFNAADAELMEKALDRPEAFKGIIFQLHFILEGRLYGRPRSENLFINADLEKWIKQLK